MSFSFILVLSPNDLKARKGSSLEASFFVFVFGFITRTILDIYTVLNTLSVFKTLTCNNQLLMGNGHTSFWELLLVGQRRLGLEFQIVGAESLVGGEVEWKCYKADIMHVPKDKVFKTPPKCCFHKWKSHGH